METSMTLPLDDGFLRRECPHCERQFKWFSGPTAGRPNDVVDPPVYWCPYCAMTAPVDEWWTAEQLDFAETTLAGPVMEMLAEELTSALPSPTGGLIKISTEVSYEESAASTSLLEPPDMIAVEPPCHPWEPIKVDEAWNGPLHCLFCGTAFALG